MVDQKWLHKIFCIVFYDKMKQVELMSELKLMMIVAKYKFNL